MLSDVVQVEADQVLLGLRGLLVGHSSSSLDVPGQIFLASAVGPGQGPPTAHVRHLRIPPDQPQILKWGAALLMRLFGDDRLYGDDRNTPETRHGIVGG